MPTRLPYKLPEWAPRVIYASSHANEVWAPRIAAISNAWITAERDSVAAGIRHSALQTVSPERLPDLLKEEAQRGLLVLPLSQTAKTNGYQSASKTVNAGDPFDYKVAITTSAYAAEWADAWSRSNDRAIGSLLSTPACCIDAFERYWNQEHWIDLTWPTHQHTPITDGYNGLLRWLGIRGVSHLPCSPTCPETVALSNRLVDNMRVRDPQEAEWLNELLSWPTLWTSLGGIAEITNPILRMSVPTDALSERTEVRYEGTRYPAEGANGNRFPFRLNTPAQPLPFHSTPNPQLNGFTSVEAMTAAHDWLLKIAPGPYGTVLDLGCGDAELLLKIPAKRRVGIESDPIRAKRASTRIDRVILGDCTDPAVLDSTLREEKPNLVIAQRDRNPPDTLTSCTVLSYSYEPNATPPTLLTALVCQ